MHGHTITRGQVPPSEPGLRRPIAAPRAWPHLALADLADDARLLVLARLLVRRELLPRSEASCLLVFAAAEHALAIGRDPAALFASTLRHPERITDQDESRGRLRALSARGRVAQPGRHHPGCAPLGELLARRWLT